MKKKVIESTDGTYPQHSGQGSGGAGKRGAGGQSGVLGNKRTGRRVE